MLKSSRIIALNLSSQTLGLAEFCKQPHGGIILLNYRLREFPMNLGSDEIHHGQRLTTLSEMMAELGIGSGAVNYAVPAQSVFTRFVNLPPVDDEKIERIIAFEARQNIPFPIDQVIWDYQIFRQTDDDGIRVMLVAIKTGLLEEINTAVERTRLRTRIVEVPAMALYNAFRYNYRDVTGSSLLVDLGARATNLLFVEPHKLFARTIRGSSVTASTPKRSGGSSEAGEFGKECCDNGPSTEPAVIEAALIPTSSRVTMTRLHAELMRSITHYRVQQQGSAPDRLFLCGQLATTSGIREFFSEKFDLPIEYFNPLRNVAIASSLPVEEVIHSAHLFGELVGLALRSVGDCRLSINLCAAVVARRQDLEKRQPFLMIAAAAVILALLGWGFYYGRASQVTRAVVKNIKTINAPMQAAEAKIEKLRQQAVKLDLISTPVVEAINDRFFWPDILEDLNARLPEENIWITELIPMCGGKPVGVDQKTVDENLALSEALRLPVNSRLAGPAIDGLLVRGLYLYNAKQQEVVVDYFKNLVASPVFKLDPNDPSRAIKSTIPNNSEWAFPYELRLQLKRPLAIP